VCKKLAFGLTRIFHAAKKIKAILMQFLKTETGESKDDFRQH
jgi:hypothetical protein